MKRRHFLITASAAGIGAMSANVIRHRHRTGSLRAALGPALTPAAAAQSAADKAQAGAAKLGEGDIFWSVMWPYMTAVGKAEGTVSNPYGINPYQVIYTYDQFSDFSDHPRRAHPILDTDGQPTGKVSDAAGWPQFISTTWDQLRRRHPFWYDGPAFQPANQDLGFLYLHRETGAHAALMAGVEVEPTTQRLTVAYDAFAQAIALDSREWASLPGANIGAATGQHTRPLWWLWSQFQWALWGQMGYRRKIVHPLADTAHLVARMGYQIQPQTMNWGEDFECPDGSWLVAPEAGTVTGSDAEGDDTFSFHPLAQPEVAILFQHCQRSRMLDVNRLVEGGKPMGQTSTRAHIEVIASGHHMDPHYYLGMAQWF